MSAVVQKLPSAKGGIVVEKNIQVPAKKVGGTVSIYPWKTMDVGDSFEIPVTVKIASFRSQASRTGSMLGRKFIVRECQDGTHRCWRIT